jgi:hypothetical protein
LAGTPVLGFCSCAGGRRDERRPSQSKSETVGTMDHAFSQSAALLAYSAVNACKFGLAFQTADDILD